MLLQRILFLLSLLLSNSVAIVVLQKCMQCVNKGCGYCSKTGRSTSAYDQTICTCDHHEFNFGQSCNDIKVITDGQNYGHQYYGNYQGQDYYNQAKSYNQETGETIYYGWNSGDYHTVKTRTSFGCHLHAEPKKTKSLIALFSILGSVSILCLILYLCHLYCPKRGKGSVGNKALLLERDPLEDALDEAEKVVDKVASQADEVVDVMATALKL